MNEGKIFLNVFEKDTFKNILIFKEEEKILTGNNSDLSFKGLLYHIKDPCFSKRPHVTEEYIKFCLNLTKEKKWDELAKITEELENSTECAFRALAMYMKGYHEFANNLADLVTDPNKGKIILIFYLEKENDPKKGIDFYLASIVKLFSSFKNDEQKVNLLCEMSKEEYFPEELQSIITIIVEDIFDKKQEYSNNEDEQQKKKKKFN